jgi:hypothetical protein
MIAQVLRSGWPEWAIEHWPVERRDGPDRGCGTPRRLRAPRRRAAPRPLHGWPSNSREWGRQIDALSNEFTVVAWDAPGGWLVVGPPGGVPSGRLGRLSGGVHRRPRTGTTSRGGTVIRGARSRALSPASRDSPHSDPGLGVCGLGRFAARRGRPRAAPADASKL